MQNQRVITVAAINAAFIIWTMAASYGKFDMTINSYESCKGPRRKDCARLTYTIIPGNRVQAAFLEIFENTTVDTTQISAYRAYSLKSEAPIYSLKLHNPCEQAMIGGNFNFWAISGKNCIVKKGKYNFNVDSYSMTQKLWNGNFFYGNFIFKILYYGPKCNMTCCLLNVTYSPKE